MRRTKPSKNPETNPPICAELSTPGINPTAKFKAITTISDNIAEHYKDIHNFSLRIAYLLKTCKFINEWSKYKVKKLLTLLA